jgi:2-methylcitrate dehydratase PrpD
MTPLAQLGSFVARDIRGGISAARQRDLALHVFDTVAAWVATGTTPEARILRELYARSAATDPALDLGLGCALTRLSEIDDIHLASMITPGAIVIPAAITIAASLRTDPVALSEAIAAGYEAMIRLGLALDGPSILYRGIWPSYIAAPFGVAAVAARLFELSAEAAANALALALTLAAPGVGQQHASTGSRWLAIGNAARNGLFAAQAADVGFTSDLNLFENGFFSTVFGITPRTSQLVEDLGTNYKFEQVSLKPWCAARQTMAGTQALREILDTGVSPADITAIEVLIPPPFLKMIDHGIGASKEQRFGNRIARLTSQPYQLAIAALAPDLAFDLAQNDEVPDDVLRFMDKITVRADAEVLQDFPRRWPACLRVRARQGDHERTIVHVPGDPERQLDGDARKAKARRLIGAATDEIASRCDVVFNEPDGPARLIALIDQVSARSRSAQQS